jgi:hypothetical protein
MPIIFHATRPISDKHKKQKTKPHDNDQPFMYIEPRLDVPNIPERLVLLLFIINALNLIDKVLKPDQKSTGLFLRLCRVKFLFNLLVVLQKLIYSRHDDS